MRLYDCESDAKRAFEVVAGGGVAVIPMHVGYAIVGATNEAVRRIFKVKQRGRSSLTNALP